METCRRTLLGGVLSAILLPHVGARALPGEPVPAPLNAAPEREIAPLSRAITSGVVAAYGTTRLDPSYSGPAVRVQRASDGQQADIGFYAERLDAAALAGFLSGTTGRVVCWYDQSGGGLQAMEPYATAPDIGMARIGGILAVSFRPGACKLSLPEGVAVMRDSYAVIAVKQNRNHSINAGYWQLGAAPAPFHSLTARNVLTPPTIYTRSDEGMVPLRVVPDINPALVVLTVGADATALHINEAATPFETPGAGMLRGGFIGRCDAGHSGPQDCAAFIVVSRSLTSGELADLKGRAYANHEIRSATTGVVLHVGASTTEGTGSVQNLNLTRFEERAFTDTYPRIYGVGVSAVGIAEMRDQLARFGPLVAAPAQKNILFAFVGGNNINKGMTAADLFSAVSALVSEAGAAGYIPIITTLLPRRTFTDRQREERARFNTLLRASSHRIADFAADPVMGSDAAAADTRLYTDGIHMTSQGYSRLAAISAPVIEQALRS